MNIQDFNSIFQLACAYNFVLGAYSAYRTDREREVREEIELANFQLREIADASGKKINLEENCPLDDLHTWELKKFNVESLPELNAYRRDIALRFYRGLYRRKTLDGICGLMLTVAGFSALSALFYAANTPTASVDLQKCNAFCIAIIIVPLLVMVRLIIEKFFIERSSHRPDSKNKDRGRKKIMRSKYTRGEIHKITLHIRRLHGKHVP